MSSTRLATVIYQRLLNSALVWGGLSVVLFYGAIHAGILDSPLILRYFTHHPVEYVQTVLFAIGLAALVLRAIDIAGQQARLGQPKIEAPPASLTAAQCAEQLLAQLGRLGGRLGDSYVRRLREAAAYVAEHGSAEGLADEMKYIADAESARMHQSYGLFRVIVWAIPIFGFLGTVIGITMALNSIDPDAIDQSMFGVLSALGLKFDTTALGLSLSIVLVFIHYFVERADLALCEQAERLAVRQVAIIFPSVPAGPEGQVVAVRQMGETMVRTAESLVERQAALWQQSMDAAAARWVELSQSAGTQLQTALAAALEQSLAVHAQQLAATQQEQLAQAQAAATRLHEAQAALLDRMGEVTAAAGQQLAAIAGASEASGEIVRLEAALNQNLEALATAGQLQETLVNLSAAVNLLCARLSEVTGAKKSVRLRDEAKRAA